MQITHIDRIKGKSINDGTENQRLIKLIRVTPFGDHA